MDFSGLFVVHIRIAPFDIGVFHLALGGAGTVVDGIAVHMNLVTGLGDGIGAGVPAHVAHTKGQGGGGQLTEFFVIIFKPATVEGNLAVRVVLVILIHHRIHAVEAFTPVFPAVQIMDTGAGFGVGHTFGGHHIHLFVGVAQFLVFFPVFQHGDGGVQGVIAADIVEILLIHLLNDEITVGILLETLDTVFILVGFYGIALAPHTGVMAQGSAFQHGLIDVAHEFDLVGIVAVHLEFALFNGFFQGIGGFQGFFGHLFHMRLGVIGKIGAHFTLFCQIPGIVIIGLGKFPDAVGFFQTVFFRFQIAGGAEIVQLSGFVFLLCLNVGGFLFAFILQMFHFLLVFQVAAGGTHIVQIASETFTFLHIFRVFFSFFHRRIFNIFLVVLDFTHGGVSFHGAGPGTLIWLGVTGFFPRQGLPGWYVPAGKPPGDARTAAHRRTGNVRWARCWPWRRSSAG